MTKGEKEKDITALLLCYERDFFNAAFCRNRAALAERLSDGFVEHGASGGVYRKPETVAALSELQYDRLIVIEEYNCEKLADDIWFVRYVSVHMDADRRALRCSIWQNEDGAWRMVFHQGTWMGE